MSKPYVLSFVAGGLLHAETQEILRRFIQIKNWDQIREAIVQGELLHATRASSRIRYFHEIRRRIRVAHPFEIDSIVSDQPDSKLANFALCCRYYAFLSDFVLEVVREKLGSGDRILMNMDYYSFFEKKTSIHPELAALTESSRRKVQTVTIRMLSEAGILDRGSAQIIGPTVSATLLRHYVKAGDQQALLHLLVGAEKFKALIGDV